MRLRFLSEPTSIPTMRPERCVHGFSIDAEGQPKIACQGCPEHFVPPTIPAGWLEVENESFFEYWCPKEVDEFKKKSILKRS